MQSNLLNFMQTTFFTDSKCCTIQKKHQNIEDTAFLDKILSKLFLLENWTSKVKDAFQMKNKGRIKSPPQVSNPLYPTSETYAISS